MKIVQNYSVYISTDNKNIINCCYTGTSLIVVIQVLH